MKQTRRLSHIIRSCISVLITLSISISVFLSSAVSVNANGQDTDNGYSDPGRTVRIGFYPVDGGQMTYSDGSFGGYYFDYLQAISQYTGWNYAYVQGSFSECYDMMLHGKIDLMCGINKTKEREKVLDFSDTSENLQRYKLYVPIDRSDVTYEDYKSFNGLRVAVIKDDAQIDVLKCYCYEHNIHMTFIPFDTEDDLAQAMSDDKVDAVYANYTDSKNRDKIIEYFPADSLYYASSKNSDIMDTFNEASKQISNNNPDFDRDLYDNYFSSRALCSIPSFTAEEKKYIKEHPVIKAAYHDNWKPIDYENKSDYSAHGISEEFLSRISKISGLKFEYVPFSDNIKAESAVVNEGVDLLCAAPFNFRWASRKGMNLSSPYADTSIVKVSRRTKSDSTELAVTKQLLEYNENIVPSNAKLHFYSSSVDCLNAVKAGNAAETYLNYFTASYYLKSTQYSSLVADEYNEDDLPLCFAMSSRKDQILLSIIDKSLLCMSSSEKNSIVYSSLINPSDNAMQILLYTDPLRFIFLIVIIFILFSMFMIFISFVHRKETKKIQYLSERDPLTGIYNRGTSHKQIDELLAHNRRNSDGRVNSLIILDLDHFKHINDTYGHPEGDILLKRVAAVIPECLRPDDVYGRLGGDEFIIYLNCISDTSAAELIAERICKKIENLENENPKWKSITASLGIVCTDTGSGLDMEALYKCADIALYSAKHSGRGHWTLYKDAE